MQQQFKYIIKNLRDQPAVWDLNPEICWIHKWIYFIVPTLGATWRLPGTCCSMEHRECNSEYYLGLNDSTNEFVGEKELFSSTTDINTHISHMQFMCIRGICGFVYKKEMDKFKLYEYMENTLMPQKYQCSLFSRQNAVTDNGKSGKRSNCRIKRVVELKHLI